MHKDVTTEEFLGNMPKNLKVTANANMNLLGVGFYTKKMFWNFGANLRTDNNLVISPDLFRVVKSLGNGTHDLGSTALKLNAYVETYAGVSFPLFKWLTIGVRGKFLIGMANLRAEFNKLALTINEDIVTAQMDGEWRANSIVLTNEALAKSGEVKFNDLLDFSQEHLTNSLNSFGTAIDFGVEMRFMNDHLKVSAAVTDLGFIKWGKDTHIGGRATGGFEFTGVALGDAGVNTDDVVRPINGEEDFINLEDGIMRGTYDGYANRLTCSLNAGVEYNMLKNKIAFGLFSQTKMLNTTTSSTYYSEITASVNLRPMNWISATVSHTMLNGNDAGIFGAAINIHPSVLNIYVAADFIDPNFVLGPEIEALGGKNLLISRYAKTINLYAGVGFNFGRPKFIREQVREMKAESKAKREERRSNK
jgi:hypothetical protein